MREAPLPDLGDYWRPIADGRYLGTTPSKRFPVYTRGNAGEVYPQVMYPLSFSFSWAASAKGFSDAVLVTGIITPKDLAGEPGALAGVFGGYTYLNLSAMRLTAHRSPGVTIESVDQQYLGASTAPAFVPAKGDRNLLASLRGVLYGLRTIRAKTLPQVEIDRRRAQEAIAALPDLTTADDRTLVDASIALQPLGAELFRNHLIVSGAASVPVGLLAVLCEKKVGKPEILGRLLGGAGGVASAAPSTALWALGRRVAASPTLTACFDQGITGLHDRIGSLSGADVDAFRASFADFLREFGSRGPNEWEIACPTWGTDPDMALALVDRMRSADESHDPARGHERLVKDREAAMAEVAQKVGRGTRKRIESLVRNAHLYAQGREQQKTTVVGLLHGSRLIMREVGRRCAERGGGRPDDIAFVVQEELDAYLADPASMAPVIAERRRMREELSRREPPFIIDGEIPPFETWAVRGTATGPAVRVGDVLRGISGCAGVARGRARVVLDPTDPTALEPGDVLVAPITDPAWTPLFIPAEAVIVDVGAMLSHAVIVSRELGIPCVVSVTGATTTIPDGALVEVDGAAGTVTVLEIP